MAALVRATVAQNAAWRGRECINLVAAESPTSQAVREMLSSEIGIRASGGHIGRTERFFTGMDIADKLEAQCVELLKRAFNSSYADHRLLGGMAGVMVAYTALAKPGDVIMSAPLRYGGDTCHRMNGPAGTRGLQILDIPFDNHTLNIDLDQFESQAKATRPVVVGIGMACTLFPMPVREMSEIISPWGGHLYFDAAHQLGLIAGGVFPNPLESGAALLTGSSGKTFSGPQGGIIVWNRADLSQSIYDTIFPTLTGSHQMNRVAALAIAVTEQLAFGPIYMSQVVANAKRLASELDRLGVPVIGRARGYTETHQVLFDARSFGGGEAVVRRLEEANIICNKMPHPEDSDAAHDCDGAVRLGTTEVTRLGMDDLAMTHVAEFIVQAIKGLKPLPALRGEVNRFRQDYQDLYFTHETGSPLSRSVLGS